MSGSRSGRIGRVVTILVLVVAGTGLGAPSAGAAQVVHYVAVGDSSVAGPLIPNQIDAKCYRSDHNWPHVVAAQLGFALTDVSCSGAHTSDLPDSQFGALTTDTDLVTIEAGVNDIDLAGALTSCMNQKTSCKPRYTPNGTDVLASRIAGFAGVFGSTLDDIHRRAPHAYVVVVSYPTYWQPGGCSPRDPILPVDADYLQGTFDSLIRMEADQASRHNAYFIDIRTPSVGHGVCAAAGQEWVEGAKPIAPAFQYHPNATGMAASAKVIVSAIRAAGG